MPNPINPMPIQYKNMTGWFDAAIAEARLIIPAIREKNIRNRITVWTNSEYQQLSVLKGLNRAKPIPTSGESEIQKKNVHQKPIFLSWPKWSPITTDERIRIGENTSITMAISIVYYLSSQLWLAYIINMTGKSMCISGRNGSKLWGF